jgi:hypothetical protein
MKTIENHVVDKYLSQRKLPVHKRIPAENYIDWAQFGAIEAQRWISIDEELPEIGQRVLCKGDNLLEVLTFTTSGFMSDMDVKMIFNVSYWRPIERL